MLAGEQLDGLVRGTLTGDGMGDGDVLLTY